jgi:hypothetical protein
VLGGQQQVLRPQALGLLGELVMVGSLIQQNFGETVKHHGYGIYDVETNEYTFHDLPNEQPFLHFRINDIKDIENETEEHVNLG